MEQANANLERDARHYEEPDVLSRHEDLSVRVWNAHLDGDSLDAVARWQNLSRARAKRILEEAPPALIAADMRYRTGQIAWWIAQGEKDVLTTKSGDKAAFIVILEPRKLSAGLRSKALSAIRRSLRDSGKRGFGFGDVYERAPMAALLRMVHDRGYPAWEIDAQGQVRPYDNRHAAANAAPEAKETLR